MFDCLLALLFFDSVNYCKMAEVSFSPRAYCKILLHAAKYPHCAINGLLLAKQRGKGDNKSHELLIEDAIPLFHVCLHVSPMSEVALTLVSIILNFVFIIY